jgi:hypothetical protein
MRFIVSFLKVAEMIEISETITVCRDPKDDKLLELAISGSASFLLKSIIKSSSSSPDFPPTNPFSCPIAQIG